MRLTAILCLSLLASACQTIPLTDNYIRSNGWAKRGEQRQAQPAAYWCYRTIGRPECSTTPIPGQEHRLIEGGMQPPAPAPFPPPPIKPTPAAKTGPNGATPPAMQQPTAQAPKEEDFIDRTVNFFNL